MAERYLLDTTVLIDHALGRLQALEYVSTSPEAADWAAAFRRRRGRSGRCHLGDALVAGVAWSLGATIVTRNPRDFEGHGVPVLAYGQPAG